MSGYTGKICPYCKTPFQPDDEIIVCSACDMPHHKDCWIENQGCTTFGCMGTIKAVDHTPTSVTATQMQYEQAPAPAVPAFIFCTECGARQPGDSRFCSACGSKLCLPRFPNRPPVQPTPQAFPQAVPPRPAVMPQPSAVAPQSPYQAPPPHPMNVDIPTRRLINTKTEYYVPKFQLMRARNQKASWNWPAFLVAPYWLIYRKMYAFGAAALAVDLIIALIGSPFLSLLALGGYITFGILGNYIYMKHLEGKAREAQSLPEPQKTRFIMENGGVNGTATALVAIARVVVAIAILMF